jgi:DNA-binding SARP family transcriptional activator
VRRVEAQCVMKAGHVTMSGFCVLKWWGLTGTIYLLMKRKNRMPVTKSKQARKVSALLPLGATLPYSELDEAVRENPEQALAESKRFLDKQRKSGNRHGIADGLHVAAKASILISKFSEAEAFLAEAREIYEQEGDALVQAQFYLTEGRLYSYQSLRAKAAEQFEKGLRIAERIEDENKKLTYRASAKNFLSVVHIKAGRREEALRCLQEGLADALQAKNVDLEIGLRLNLGATYMEISRRDEGLEMYLKTLDLLKQVPEYRDSGLLYGNLAIHYQFSGDYAKSLEFYMKMIEFIKRKKNFNHLPNALVALALYYYDIGDEVVALRYAKEALAYAEKTQNKEHLAHVYRCISEGYMRLGKLLPALDYRMNNLKIIQELGLKKYEAFAMKEVGVLYQMMNSEAEALKYFLHARQIFQDIQDHIGEAVVAKSLGEVYQKWGDYDIALDFYQQSDVMLGNMGNKKFRLEAWLSMANLYTERDALSQNALSQSRDAASDKETGDSQRAEQALRFALTLAEETQLKKVIADVRLKLADLLKSQGQRDESETHYRIGQSLRRELAQEESAKRAQELILEIEVDRIQKEAVQHGVEKKLLSVLEKAVRQTPAPHLKESDSKKETDSKKQASSSVVAITVTTLGTFSVRFGEKEMQVEDWQRKRARQVFKYLLMRYGKSVTVDELLDAIWPDSDAKSAEILLATSLTQVRKALAIYMPKHRFIKTRDRSYLLQFNADAEHGAITTIDFLEFKSLIENARKALSNQEKRARYEKALAHYGGEFLREDAMEEWTSYERETLKDAYLSAAGFLADHAFAEKDYSTAHSLARKMLDQDATLEKAYQVMIKSLLAQSLPAEAQKVFQQCAVAFKKELDSPPPPSIVKLMGN